MFKKKEPKLKKLKAEPKLESAPVEESVPTPEPERLTPKDEAKPESKEEVLAPVDPDYIRQYQYKNVNNQPTVGGLLTDPDLGTKAAVMKKSLLSQPKVNIFIPRGDKESPLIKFSVTLNGYRLDFPKNDLIEVPLQIAEVIGDSLKQQASALLPFQVGRDKATQDALS